MLQFLVNLGFGLNVSLVLLVIILIKNNYIKIDNIIYKIVKLLNLLLSIFLITNLLNNIKLQTINKYDTIMCFIALLISIKLNK